MTKQRAISLAELLVAMSACSVILTMSTVLIHRAMHIQSESRSFFDIERTGVRLFDQFRRDVHQAESTLIDKAKLDEGVFVQLKLPGDQIVEYRQQNQQIVRLLSRGGRTVWREEYSFPNVVDLSIRTVSSPNQLVLTVTAVPDALPQDESRPRFSSRTMPVLLQVSAAIGRHRRAIVDARQE